MKKILALVMASLCAWSGGIAQDRIFNFTYQSTVLGLGQKEVEVWNSLRTGRESFYRGLDQRLEFEIGIGSHVQTSFYMNVESFASNTTGTGLSHDITLSFSNEWKYKLLDPVADPLGLALYGEITAGTSAVAFEPRLILDKSVGSFMLAFNGAAEFEFEKEIAIDGSESTEKETELEFSFAAGLPVSHGVTLSVEVLSMNGLHEGAIEYSALYAGPTISFATDGFWVNLTLLPQIAALKGATSQGLVLNEAERMYTRLLFSIAL